MGQKNKIKERIRGVSVALCTPTLRNYEIDYEGLKEETRFVIEGGVTEGKGVLKVAAALGEGQFLKDVEYRRVLETVVDASNSKVPVLAGIFGGNVRHAIEMAKLAEDIGIDGLQVQTPSYSRPSEEEVFLYYKMINDATNLGILVYNTPWAASGFEIRPQLMSRLAELDNVVAVKWECLDVINWAGCLRLFSEKLNFIDNSWQTHATGPLGHMLGAKGLVSFTANFDPKLDLEFWSLLENRQYDKFIEIWSEKVVSFWVALGENPLPSLGEGPFMKALMELAGKPCGPPLPPQVELTDENKEKLRKVCTSVGLIKK